MVEHIDNERGYHLEGVAFGMTDGMICFLGIIIGVAEATQNLGLVLITSIVGGIADAMGNSFGFFTSQLTERSVQLHSKQNHGQDIRVHSKEEVWMSGILSFFATILALVLLLVPFLLLPFQMATIATFIVGVTTLFLLGMFVGNISNRSLFKTGLTFAALGLIGAVISHLIGDFLRHLIGTA